MTSDMIDWIANYMKWWAIITLPIAAMFGIVFVYKKTKCMSNSRTKRKRKQWLHDFQRDHKEEISKYQEQARKKLNGE